MSDKNKDKPKRGKKHKPPHAEFKDETKPVHAIKLPIPHGTEFPEPAVVVHAPFIPAEVLPLPEPVGNIPGTLFLVRGWSGDYYWFVPDCGATIAGVGEDGRKCGLQVTPPPAG